MRIRKNTNKNDKYKKNLFLEVLKYILAHKRIQKYTKYNNFKLVKFNDLKNNKKNTIEDICKFLNINFQKNLLEDKFKQNTSFNGKIKKEEILNKYDKIVIKVLYSLLKELPLFLFDNLHKLKKLFENEYSTEKFIPGTFAYKKNELKEQNINFNRIIN